MWAVITKGWIAHSFGNPGLLCIYDDRDAAEKEKQMRIKIANLNKIEGKNYFKVEEIKISFPRDNP